MRRGRRYTLASLHGGGPEQKAIALLDLGILDRLSVGEETSIGRGHTLKTDTTSADPRFGFDPELDSPATAPILPIVKGPHLDRFSANALELLCAVERTVSAMSDRVGVRLEGPAVPREGVDDGVPEPMRPGAVQIATDGTPIVLGPDSAVTGGYPVLAVVTETGRARLARVRPGGRVRFSVRD